MDDIGIDEDGNLEDMPLTMALADAMGFDEILYLLITAETDV